MKGDHNWGWKQGLKQSHEAAGGDKVSVKQHTRKPRAITVKLPAVVTPKKEKI